MLPNFPSDESKSQAMYHIGASGATLIQAINNPDGSTAFITIDTGEPMPQSEMITLADGSQARVLHAVFLLTYYTSYAAVTETFKTLEMKDLTV